MPCWLTPEYWEKAGHPETWATIIISGFTAILALLAVALAAYLTYRFTLKHSKIVHNTAIKRDRLRREIDALEKLWSLLAYMTLAENEQAIVRYRENEKGEKEYFFHYGNLKRFLLNKISNVFYEKGAGLYMPRQIRDCLFSYKHRMMGLYMCYEKDKSITDKTLIPIENKMLCKYFQPAYDELNGILKAELEKRYNNLIFKIN